MISTHLRRTSTSYGRQHPKSGIYPLDVVSAPHEERSGPAQRLGPPQADGLRQAAPRPRSFIPPRQRGLFAGGPPPSSGSFGRHVTSVWRRDVRTVAALSAATSGQLPLAVLHSLNLVPKPSKCDERRWERRDQTHRRPDRGGLPDWSSEGTRIAFAGDRDDNINIYVLNADGSGLKRLSDNPAVDLAPAWSPVRTS